MMKNNLNSQTRPLDGVKVLLVDDEDLLAWSIDQELSSLGAQVIRVTSLSTALDIFPKELPDVALVDLSLPDGNGIELVKKWHLDYPNTPNIVITAHAGIDSAIQAVRSNAYDYLKKPFDMALLVSAVTRSVEVSQLREKVSRMQGTRATEEDCVIIGSSAKMMATRKSLERVAKSKVDTILIYGESGSGKELAARTTHFASDRAKQPFIEINCASIPETLLESELFGFERGAFTDARERKLGLFEIAQSGTIFLDEIGEMPLKLQAKLLRVLEYRRFKRLGGTKDVRFSARIVAATHRHLSKEVFHGNFRADLYYRLNVIDITLPPLREHQEDLKELLEFLLVDLCQNLECNIPRIHPDTLHHLKNHSWPGNVRELRNLLQKALVLHQPKELLPEHLEFIPAPHFVELAMLPDRPTHDSVVLEKDSGISLPKEGICLDEVEKTLITQALVAARYNQTRAARLLGISRHTLRYRLEKHSLSEISSFEGENHA